MHLEFTEFCAGMFGGGVKLKEESLGHSSAASLKGCRIALHIQLHELRMLRVGGIVFLREEQNNQLVIQYQMVIPEKIHTL